MTAKIGYRTHAELMQAWDLLRCIAWEPTLEMMTCPFCGRDFDKHAANCPIAQARKLLVDPPQSDPVAHTNHLSAA